ncbi:BsuBI/PstI family type II restriction endonuclease [Bacillus wiedmannii]|uniref:site-specific DNA-methyltransferase (adenine-specific) n=1 Tax=Bacillus wiedmannii TaxID=1890302 RepID=A0A2B5IT52_9BACI|nr:BsuBI/PstI family type II restriction endonuclease [Bacillus wiedmannii]PFZ28024.1 hypothetical protein COL66_18505 [Bacillus wiedmannii]
MSSELIDSSDVLRFVEKASINVNEISAAKKKKEIGQYFTSSLVAEFMAERVNFKKSNIKILDPGSGTGMLTAALVARIVKEKKKNVHLEIDLFENDEKVLPFLYETMEMCKGVMERQGNKLSYKVHAEDFILVHKHLFEACLLDEEKSTKKYDLVISNPPYYKLNKNHIYSQILKEYVHGQPNIYFMFMVIAEKLLVEEGQLVFITPRSYCSGAYFERFRDLFFKSVDPDHFHLFESRKGNFKSENVLQETIILSGFKRKEKRPYITISSSLSLNIQESYSEEVFNKSLIIDSTDQINLIRLPVNKEQSKILQVFDNWSNNLTLMNMNISTGLVVAFRHKEYIKDYDEKDSYPLLYMKNLKQLEVAFPLEQNNQGIVFEAIEKRLVVPASNYVLLKRFTSKEQKKRIDCGTYLAKKYAFKMLGLENHLNYIYKIDEGLSEVEALGVAAFLNSNLVDQYFRIVNGNTQVNASDIRPLPFPEYDFIVKLGRDILKKRIGYPDVDAILEEEFINETKQNVEEHLELGEMNKEEQAKSILLQLGLPKKQQNKRSALSLLALVDIKEDDEWSAAQKRLLRIVDIMDFMAKNYDQVYAPNSREAIRRQTVHQFEQANLIERNPDDPSRPTHSGNTVYAVTDEFLSVVKTYGTNQWLEKVTEFKQQFSTLSQKYEQKRNKTRIPVKIGEEEAVSLSVGEHKVLQKQIVEDFGAIFAAGSELVYLGDAEKEYLYIKAPELEELNIPPFSYDKLPDVVLYDRKRNWLFLIEAVTSHGPVSPKRLYELEKILESCSAGRIYVTAFPDMSAFKKYADDIAWDTEVWFADAPEHMMHLNGDRFLGPRKYL